MHEMLLLFVKNGLNGVLRLYYECHTRS